MALVDLAKTKSELGDSDSAAAGFEDALERIEQAEQHRESGYQALVQMRPAVLVLAAQSHERLGRIDQAEARILLAAGYLAERWGPETPRLIVPYAELARILRGQPGREAEAADLEDRVVILRRLQAGSGADGELSGLRQKLEAGEAVLYGSSQCEQTKKQLSEVSGLDSAYRYVDCGMSASARDACEAQGVNTFPTWLINGQRINGSLSKRQLEQACDHVARV